MKESEIPREATSTIYQQTAYVLLSIITYHLDSHIIIYYIIINHINP